MTEFDYLDEPEPEPDAPWFAAIPGELRALSQWVLWRREERDGKATKVPYQADGQRKASTTDPATWATFAAALEAVEVGGIADGLGFVFSPDDGYCGVDLDAGLSKSERGAIMATLDSYSEFSPSGQGVHVILRAGLNGHGRNRKGPFEVYEDGRYFTFTGAHVRGTPTTIEARQPQLDEILERFPRLRCGACRWGTCPTRRSGAGSTWRGWTRPGVPGSRSWLRGRPARSPARSSSGAGRRLGWLSVLGSWPRAWRRGRGGGLGVTFRGRLFCLPICTWTCSPATRRT